MRGAAGIFVFLLIAPFGLSAEQPNRSSTPKVQQFEEIERGFWLRTTLGLSVAVNNAFGPERSSELWPPGPVIQIEAGHDLGQVASIHLALYGQQVVGSRDVGGRATVSNDAAMLAVLLGGRFNLLTTKRLAWFLKANAGWMFTAPDLAQFDPGVLIQAGTGFEYATLLRHFFVGLEACAAYDVANGGVLVLLTPSLKYTF